MRKVSCHQYIINLSQNLELFYYLNVFGNNEIQNNENNQKNQISPNNFSLVFNYQAIEEKICCSIKEKIKTKYEIFASRYNIDI